MKLKKYVKGKSRLSNFWRIVAFYSMVKTYTFEMKKTLKDINSLMNKLDRSPELKITSDDIKNLNVLFFMNSKNIFNYVYFTRVCSSIQRFLRYDQLPELPRESLHNLIYYEWDPMVLDLKRCTPWQLHVLWSIWIDEDTVRDISIRTGLSKSEVHITNKKIIEELYEL